jgi:hypothetical protein
MFQRKENINPTSDILISEAEFTEAYQKIKELRFNLTK